MSHFNFSAVSSRRKQLGIERDAARLNIFFPLNGNQGVESNDDVQNVCDAISDVESIKEAVDMFNVHIYIMFIRCMRFFQTIGPHSSNLFGDRSGARMDRVVLDLISSSSWAILLLLCYLNFDCATRDLEFRW